VSPVPGPPRDLSPSAPEELVPVVGARYTGLQRTDERWLASYVDLQYPAAIPPSDVQRIARRLLTTGVFTDVRVELVPVEGAPATAPERLLAIRVEEKWTTIPVIRGVYGGGTPLRIIGLYDIHTLGRLLTLGGEVRKYGDAPPGFVLYARDPRHQAGRYYLGAEFWRDFRRRDVYDRGGEQLGRVSTNSTMGRVRVLRPLRQAPPGSPVDAWKFGLDIEMLQEAPSAFDPMRPEDGAEPAAAPRDLHFADVTRREVSLLPTVQYDDIDADNLTYDGFRAEAKGGPVLATGGRNARFQTEGYWFKRLPASLNLGVHALAGESTVDTFHDQYFLGGLDSIRGLPDGAVYGTRAAYANVELRHISARMRYLWIQSVVFSDAGVAGPTWADAFDDGRAVAGLGVRFAVPQVYRMVLRIDYAWSLTGDSAHGITAGMNQFFEPYRPL
jgi:outer membrane protein assembly factor BamA